MERSKKATGFRLTAEMVQAVEQDLIRRDQFRAEASELSLRLDELNRKIGLELSNKSLAKKHGVHVNTISAIKIKAKKKRILSK